MIFSFFSNNIQTFENIDDIIDSTSLNCKFMRDFIELNDIIAFAFKMLNKFFREFLKRFGFSIIGEDFISEERGLLFWVNRL